LVLAAVASTLWLVNLPVASAQGLELDEAVQEFTLDNGLKIMMVKRELSPTISFRMLFKTGGVDEPVGKAGLAHILEHMMFKGTTTIGTKDYEKERSVLEEVDELAEKLLRAREEGRAEGEIELLRQAFEAAQAEAQMYVEPGELNRIYDENGASGFNAGTWQDGTMYMVSLPSNRLELWARLTADMIVNPVFREFYKERDVVMEERRQRTETDPTGFLREHFLATAFIAHPYGRPTVGWMSDLEGMVRKDLEQFFRRYYLPNNAVIAVVGEIWPERDIKIIQRYFSVIPSGEPPPLVLTREPKQQGERRVIVKFDAKPEVFVGYHKPTYPDREAYVFDVIDALLTGGRTSRLFKRMVDRERLALSVETGSSLPADRYHNLFFFHGVPRAPHTTEDLEHALYEEMERLKAEAVTQKELKKIKNQVRAGFIYGLQSNEDLASQLVYYEAFFGGWERMLEYADIIESVTPEEIMEVAQRYLSEDNRTVATLLEKGKREE
jgi:predicted Zn-dependent peptidase